MGPKSNYKLLLLGLQKYINFFNYKFNLMINLTNIKNIIFDLGGVILNIDYNLTVEEFKKLKLENYNKLFTQMQQSNLFNLFETGKVSPQVFREEIKKISNIEITDLQIDNAWNAMLLDFPTKRIELLRKLKNKYRTFLLSNTNIIHLKEYNKTLQNNFGLENMSQIFEKEYYSHEIGMRKPNLNIFEFVLSENNLIAKETLFIDDSPQHIAAATKLGINSYHLTDGETINDIFKI